jgi:hypothetical protein
MLQALDNGAQAEAGFLAFEHLLGACRKTGQQPSDQTKKHKGGSGKAHDDNLRQFWLVLLKNHMVQRSHTDKKSDVQGA